MPNPVPLATKEEEERRAWVTAHHEVVRLVKDCFGDRFSNNEIFDRLKISRRTGYRALGNDERIGKSPGRKPKIMSDTIKDMIDYIESGGCNDVGNVWKHLAEKFAPDCNPKTVQDAVKKSGFKNYHNQVKLEPLLNQQIPDGQPAPLDEDDGQMEQGVQQIEQAQQAQQAQQLVQQQAQQAQQQAHAQAQVLAQAQAQAQAQQQAQQQAQAQQAAQQQHQQHQALDPTFQHQNPTEVLRQAIDIAPVENVRYMLHHLGHNFPDVANLVHSYLVPQYSASQPALPAMANMAGLAHIAPQPMHGQLQMPSMASSNVLGPKRRIAVCRRCNHQFDRALNSMETRECLYHKGSPQKIAPHEGGTIESSPEAYIWSCCGGNGIVRGCCRAMHTTKKKRKYSKKRDASNAGLDDEDTGAEDKNTTMLDMSDMDDATPSRLAQMSAQMHAHFATASQALDDPNIDSALQDLPTDHLAQGIADYIPTTAPQAAMQLQNADGDFDDDGMDQDAPIGLALRRMASAQVASDSLAVGGNQ